MTTVAGTNLRTQCECGVHTKFELDDPITVAQYIRANQRAAGGFIATNFPDNLPVLERPWPTPLSQLRETLRSALKAAFRPQEPDSGFRARLRPRAQTRFANAGPIPAREVD